MELGVTYIRAAVAICVTACLVALLMAFAVRRLKKTHSPNPLTLAVIFLCLLAPGCFFLHRPLFRAWHHSQNAILPQTGCMTYEPSFFRLYATYRMTRAEFDDWVKGHPWRLVPQDEPRLALDDEKHLGVGKADVGYASIPEPSGRQLRVYHAGNTLYVFYAAM